MSLPRVARLALICTPLGLGFFSVYAVAQQSNIVRAVAIRSGKIFVNPDTNSQVVGELRPGRDVSVTERSGPYIRVLVDVSGWILDKGLVYLTDPNGPEIILGAASELENRAETLSGQRDTAEDAGRLYYRIFDDFPNSPLAGEALFRAADIKWQLDTRDTPVAKDPSMQRFPDDELLRKVRSKFSGTEWAARASFVMLDEKKNCGDWAEKPKCIDKEADAYRDFLKQYPNSPVSAHAAYEITYREAAAWSIYSGEGQHHDDAKAAQHRRLALQWAADTQRRFPHTDWAARAALVGFKVQTAMPVYGRDIP